MNDRNGQALAENVYFEDEPGRRAAAHLMLTRDEAQRKRRQHRQVAGAAAAVAADKRDVTRLRAAYSRQSAQCPLTPI